MKELALDRPHTKIHGTRTIHLKREALRPYLPLNLSISQSIKRSMSLSRWILRVCNGSDGPPCSIKVAVMRVVDAGERGKQWKNL